ncbi:MAG: HipA domain-containing protein [Acidobacteria bacterium]|nr:HipA domain-containing protein [Acidobacteriota bacterium]
MTACFVCLRELGRGPTVESYHRRCLQDLFGVATIPKIDIELAKLHTAGLAMVGRTSLSGVQRKISLGLSSDRQTLQVALGPNRYILKPQTETYPALPENEHVSMRLAGIIGIEVPPCGLFRLKDGSLAYLVLRFDRTATGSKLRQEDFCQLAEKSPKEKYDGSSELCARLIKRYADEPGVELWKFCRLTLFNWWVGNGDAHLKNFSLLAGTDGLQRLSPAYDLVATRLVIPDDQLSLSVVGKKDGLTRRNWIAFAEYCEVPERAADRMVAAFIKAVEPANSAIDRSALPDSLKADYKDLIHSRTAILSKTR